MLNIKELLDKVKASPYREIVVHAPHTGVVEFAGLKKGDTVHGREGEHMEKPGTLLANLTREKNKKPITAPEKGEVESVRTELEGKFVEAGEPLVTIKHFLTRKEVIELILQEALYLFRAPERAKYYFVPEVDQKLKVSGKRSVKVTEGMELLIVSRMKRETPLAYTGPEGIIYSVYFGRGDNVDEGEPLIGICPEDQLTVIQDVVARIQSEWDEE
ncbi:biotin attachment protein [Pseudodesulfovibrio cashew]|uniref:Biotin attachment protein n=1 Tax=Pseudodesulfovibrio cashew TaxID=2678688 RepID=A0A6I6JFB0_9BACT|nr:biotin/lipoyl-containing protein [Pseudodesulfovibrio cashew]QGY41515.1 biotin attachment protein [Pseudodesulfovibrio cashew]